MQIEPQNLKNLFQRIFAGTASQKEKEQASRWLSKLDVSEQQLSFEEIERQRLQLQDNFHSRFKHPLNNNKRRRLSLWIPAAAAAILLVIGGAHFLRKPATPKDIYTETATLAGERKIITLPDGTTITLNNGSRIKFPKEFTGKVREVYLDGEAFFNVTHDKTRPFIVNSGKLKVNVLGTSFDVHGYATDAKIDVTVTTGKVGVIAPGNRTSRMLMPGQKLSYNRKTDELEQSTVNPNDYTGWQRGDLIFKNEQLDAICQRLERWYGVKISIKSPGLKGKHISLEQDNESLQNVMKMLSIVGGFKYEINDKNVQINK